MIRKILAFTCCMIMFIMAHAQRKKLNFEDVSGASLINTGKIMRNNKITGSYVFVFKELINKDTSRYGLQIFDENNHKIREYGFTDVPHIYVKDAASADSTTAFLFGFTHSPKIELKILDASGNLKLSYTKPYLKEEGTRRIRSTYINDEVYQGLYDAGAHGYVLLLDLKYKRHTIGYEVNYFDTDKTYTWTYRKSPEAHVRCTAAFLAKTDQLIMFNVNSQRRQKFSTALTAFRFDSDKKAFEIKGTEEKYNLVPSFVIPKKGSDSITVMGYYFTGTRNVRGRPSKGIGFYDISPTGSILTKTYNAWNKELSGSLDANRKGKIKGLGYLFLHDMIGGPEGKMFVVAEGCKKAFTMETLAFKSYTTDLVLLEFDSKYHLKRSNVYEKEKHLLSVMPDWRNIHTQGYVWKKYGRFDYRFTSVSEDFKNFAICYEDTRKVSKKEIGSFHIIRFNGLKFRNDDLPLFKDKTTISVYPAKPGTLMIYESSPKGTKMRLEKIS
ncbi:DUF6770 family protein [Chitinophaga sp.]|uniref:DUF6770 family protein n=1 Tax=Chitinophaga sp. TaxID=1869181 RepID=UPI002F959EF6